MKNRFAVSFTIYLGLMLLLLNAGASISKPIKDVNLQDTLVEAQFKRPDSKYGIRCWWWWLNGNVTRASISHDLEEMKAKGFSGACIFDAGGADQRGNAQVPEGPMFGTARWRELFLHAIKEANRLGLVMSLNIQSGWNLGGPDITPEESAKQITSAEIEVKGGMHIQEMIPQPASRNNFYRDITVLAIPLKKGKSLPIRDFENKSGMREVGWSVPETRPLLTDVAGTPNEQDALVSEVINVSEYFRNGVLNWNAPKGEWRVIRIGYTPTGAHTSTTSGKWNGHVIDYMSEKAFNRYWNTHVEPLLQMIGPMAGNTLRYLQTDSFEGGGMNWTDNFEDEFFKRRGYHLMAYMPVLTGKIIENREVSNRFLADFRKTLGDLIAEKHYGTFAKRSKAYGIGIQPESAGPHAGPFDGLKNYGYSEIMMSEFWSPSPHRSKAVDRFFVKQAASAAKIFEKQLVGAESFTTIGPHWNDVIWADMKPSVDHEFCAGLNLTYLHTFTSSPKEMGLPGQEYFAGTHFNPNVTWWNYSTGFIDYLTRCQYLLQKGKSFAEVLYYYGDHVPNLGRYKQDDPAGALPGYDYDLINEDRLLDLQTKDSQLFLIPGVSYKILVLPNHKILSLAVLRKIKFLVQEGATVVGDKPLSTSSLVGYPNSETELKSIADELWGDTIAPVGIKHIGKGRVIWGQTAKQVLEADNLSADFAVSGAEKGDVFDYIHRYTPNNTDYYFISNQNSKQVSITCTFRIEDKQPELWNPLTGEVRELKVFTRDNGSISIPLTFDPYGSSFVVFRKPLKKGTADVTKTNYPDYTELKEIDGAWQLKFDPKWGGPSLIKFDSLQSWTERKEEGIKYYSGKAVYIKSFDKPVTNGKDRIYLDLGEVKDVGIARVKLNGKDMGILWSPPFRADITDAVLSKNNKLEIEIVNTWRNRLIGDRGLPADKRFTKTNITIKADWELVPSGLLGPVRLLKAQ
jgi:hypothetical protein